jgi:hypothetical protein
MTKSLRTGLVLTTFCASLAVSAQTRYIDELFNNSEVNVTSDVPFGVNIDPLTSNFASPSTPGDIMDLQTLVATGQPIPAGYFNPLDPSTVVKVRELKMDIYQPDQNIDNVTDRPVVILAHTGNLLPPPINGSPLGTKTDSLVVELGMRWAKRGYVAVAVENRHGWNPLDSTLNGRRGSLLNAVYRAIHDVKQAVRTLREDQAGPNTYAISADDFVIMGEGTGGYISQAYITLDDPSKMFIEKFRPDPFDPTTSYIDTNLVGNIEGFNGQLTLYRPNGFDSDVEMSVNLGGALADTSWLDPGHPAMVSFHTIFDPFAPFDDGVVIVPTTGEQVVALQGSNVVLQKANDFGNNDAFASLPDDAYSAVARSFYGTTQSHGSPVTISPTPEGLYPVLRPQWPAPAFEEASPWQWWDPMSPLAMTIIDSTSMITAHQASLASNPDMSASKARMYVDTIMAYTAPRVVCQLGIGPCSLVGIDENDPIAVGIDLFPNPMNEWMTVNSSEAEILSFEVHDIQGRLVRSGNVNMGLFNIDRGSMDAGKYLLSLYFEQGRIAKTFVVE